MNEVTEFVVLLDPADQATKKHIITILNLFGDNRPIFDNAVAIYVNPDTQFDQVADQIRAIVKPSEYFLFETSNRMGEGNF